jgi:hypothetical protein
MLSPSKHNENNGSNKWGETDSDDEHDDLAACFVTFKEGKATGKKRQPKQV